MGDAMAKDRLRDWLNNNGFLSYPMEMQFNGFCDVVAYQKGKFYAFEIKQKGDNISKALKQLKDYSRGVHYCIIVVDKIGKRQSQKFIDRGYGVWKRENNGYIEISKAKSVKFIHSAIEHTRKKFKRVYGSDVLPEHQLMIDDFKVDYGNDMPMSKRSEGVGS